MTELVREAQKILHSETKDIKCFNEIYNSYKNKELEIEFIEHMIIMNEANGKIYGDD
jgi:hypothetical protein